MSKLFSDVCHAHSRRMYRKISLALEKNIVDHMQSRRRKTALPAYNRYVIFKALYVTIKHNSYQLEECVVENEWTRTVNSCKIAFVFVKKKFAVVLYSKMHTITNKILTKSSRNL